MFTNEEIDKYLLLTITEAKKAYNKNEVPIGAIIVSDNGVIISKAHNLIQQHHNATNHAEILAINKACKKLKTKYLKGYSIFTSLEPCAMCATAISLCKLDSLYFASEDKKTGAIINGVKLYKNQPGLYIPKIYCNIKKQESEILLKQFFKKLREDNKNILKNKHIKI